MRVPPPAPTETRRRATDAPGGEGDGNGTRCRTTMQRVRRVVAARQRVLPPQPEGHRGVPRHLSRVLRRAPIEPRSRASVHRHGDRDPAPAYRTSGLMPDVRERSRPFARVYYEDLQRDYADILYHPSAF